VSQKRLAGIIPAKDIPPGPRGLGGYCWARDPQTGVHCTDPVGHEARYQDHWHPYTSRRWT
jgi:hypothetical protein